jgi:hypothetical protein
MSSILKKGGLTKNVHQTANDSNPIRIAFLGGPKSGKTSTISKLGLGTFQDTYYPTHKVNPLLINFQVRSLLGRAILDEFNPEQGMKYIFNTPNIKDLIGVSPVIYQSFSRAQWKPLPESSSSTVVHGRNQYYSMYNLKEELTGNYVPPRISPILVELIDTPSFDPNRVVPFLEASLYMKLDKEILRNLASEPRKPVSTNPLLVASGASELNGNIDGYFFVYSAVPCYNPPSYEQASKTESKTPSNSIQLEDIPGDNTFSLLSIIKGALDEAWREYNTFKKRWSQGKESDIFSFKSALKNIWKEQNISEIESMRQELRKQIKLVDNPSDPADPNSPPPIWLICTHANSPLKSPVLIENGAKLAKFWKCGFVSIDNANANIDEVLALMIKEILERKRLQKGKKKF